MTYARGLKGIVYTINKQHSKHVCDIYIKNGIKAATIDSDTTFSQRESILSKFVYCYFIKELNTRLFTVSG
jgi:superfamily II DNA or RNA helicase